MSTAREDLVAHLKAKLTTVRVLDTLTQLENAKRATVMVSRSSIERADLHESRDDVLTVWLVSPFLDIAKAEADLDANLDAVLAAIEDHEYLHWTGGSRDMFAEFHAFQITVPHRTLLTTEES
ncbi:hypothetical protein [Cellulosimicrobium sp. 22601]|uniref:hypothetical protein n=1 Tax=unclassified Cellulosimicrobium TaxID=2624466 RepID=UPI003F87C51F